VLVSLRSYELSSGKTVTFWVDQVELNDSGQPVVCTYDCDRISLYRNSFTPLFPIPPHFHLFFALLRSVMTGGDRQRVYGLAQSSVLYFVRPVSHEYIQTDEP
jgi:hypothetical protein